MHRGIEQRERVVILAPTGTLDATSRENLRDKLLAAAVDEPRALMVDLTALHLPSPSTLFSNVADELAQWPGVPFFIVDPHDRLPADRRVHRTVADAMAAIDDPAPPHPDPTARPAHGLTAVDRIASAWGTAPTPSGGKVVWAAL